MPVKKVLFVCIENACRSQMAEALFNKFAKGARAFSAGSRPAKEIDSKTVEVLKEKGLDIAGKKPKSVDEFRGEQFDAVVAMGCGDECPYIPAKMRIAWEIENPKGKSVEFYRKILSEIEGKVQVLRAEV
ncbi:MAG: arsenate reductase ArsC [Candidatus Anstonellaceae archaeon]